MRFSPYARLPVPAEQRRVGLSFAAASLAAGLVALASCSPVAPGRGAAPEAVPVTAATAVRKDFPVELRTIGTVEPYSTVAIKARVGGELTRVHFREGQDVRSGDLLFTIDPRTYEAALRQAQAVFEKDSARVENARSLVTRYKDLVAKDYVPQERYDAIRVEVSALEATVRADEAAVENAKVELGYCSIHSPIDGRTGRLVVHQGNLVKANDDNPLVVINQIAPIYASFSVPEKDLPEIRRRAAEGTLKVRAVVGRDEAQAVEGKLTFVDNTVDATTGTILLKATFANGETALWPGQFVDVRLRLATERDAVVVPAEAVQTGQQGSFVFVIRPDLTVESRPVTPGATLQGETVLDRGLRDGERVVTDGQLRLVPGAKVEVQTGVASGAGAGL